MSLQDAFNQINDSFSFRKECEISGSKFELGLLSLSDEQKVSSIPEPLVDGEDKTFDYVDNIKKSLLSYSIRKVNGEELPDIINEGENPKERALYLKDVLDKFPGAAVNKLFEIYVDLKEFADKEIGDSVSYDWFKTPEVREEERKKEEEERKKEEEEKTKESETSEEDDDIKFRELPKEEDEPEKDKELNVPEKPQKLNA